MTENIRRELVVGVIGRHILHNVASLGLIEEEAQKEPSEGQERWRVTRKQVEERIFALMEVADELGLYEDVTVGIPQRLLEEYREAHPPNARR